MKARDSLAWERIADVFSEALERSPEARASFLDDACVDANGHSNEVLRREVEALLAADAAAEAFGLLNDFSRFEEVLPDEERTLRTATVFVAEGRRIGPYRIIRELGRGGMGTVYLAERADGQFEQNVALKLIRPGAESDVLQERFLSERQLLARLQHPNIAHLLDGGVADDGQPYFALEFVEGEPITSFNARRLPSMDDRLELFLQVCDAVAYAHRNHVVHRDLKPSNILVAEGDQGEPQVKLLDFGIAKLLDPDDASALTQTVLNPLTPEHAAPEQIRREAITPATDVYALGLILYELLTGHRAYTFKRTSPGEIERVICEEEPARPSTVVAASEMVRTEDETPTVSGPREAPAAEAASGNARRKLKGDLDTICLKALEKDPARRYYSAGALADDLRRHLAGLPIEAHPPSRTYRAGRFVRRHRIGVLGALVALLLGIAVAFGGLRIGGDVGTDSAVAERLYEEGLRTLRSDLHGARQLFRAALEADSTFALAVYQTLLVERRLELPADTALGARMHRLVDSLPERERLFMHTRWEEIGGSPEWLPLAEKLVARYPDEVEGRLLLGRALLTSGDRPRAIRILQEIVAADEAGPGDAGAECAACEAYGPLISAYRQNDDFRSAERLARDWIRREPDDIRAWGTLAALLEYQGETDAALEAMRQTSPERQSTPYLPIYPAILDIRNGEFASADRLLREQAHAGAPDVQQQARWFLIISLRYQGRLGEALESARALRNFDAFGSAVAEGQVLFEMDRHDEAAVLFDSLASVFQATEANVPDSPAQRMFQLAHVADARAAVGELAGLAAIADTIETLGQRTIWEERRVLPYHVRGLLYARRGELANAEASFRRGIAFPNGHFTRTNLELARVLLALNRPEDAIPILEVAFRGSLETQRTYVTHTELHELLGKAYEEAGDTDRAAVHYAWVLSAWQNADLQFHARREDIRRRLSLL